MHIVYLDQNKWIELSRAWYGRSSAVELRPTLEFILRARDMRLACFPLSFGHYIETIKHRSPGARVRLARVMREISGGTCMADPNEILRCEIDEALARCFPRRIRMERVRPLRLLGKGLEHATNRPELRLHLPSQDAEGLTPERRRTLRRLESSLRRVIEEDMLSGVARLKGDVAWLPDLSDLEDSFSTELSGLTEKVEGMDEEALEAEIYKLAAIEVAPFLWEELKVHAISSDEFARLGGLGSVSFLDDLPTQRLQMHLYRQWLKNRDLPKKRSDLYDWVMLGRAVMYCDVVVTEKLFADLVGRDGFQPHATVLTDLRQLPQTLVSLAS